MGSVLKHIQETVIKYASIIAYVSKVDVEIVDAGMCRIAGTGVYRTRINEDMSSEGLVYQAVIRTGQYQLIEEPGRHRLCNGCPRCNCCEEKLEMCMPIVLEGQIIGVIGLICFDEARKQAIISEVEAYREFLEQIAAFISAKAYEYKEAERTAGLVELLNQVIEQVGNGVLILNAAAEIVHINAGALNQLALGPACRGAAVGLEATGDCLLGAEEYKLSVNGTVYDVMGQLLEVGGKVAGYEKIFIFNDIKKVKNGIYELTNIAETICLNNIIGCSDMIDQLKKKIVKIAHSASTVLITGESGTGKELVARAIHAEGGRAGKPFVAINCGAIPDALLESELFGYVKGAFTGADPKGKIGKFELANKGVIFLDEIGDMPLYLQVKILRVLQERSITRIGSNQQIAVDVRVIAATNQDLSVLMEQNKFRGDLYYRLNVIKLEVPPLRRRPEDIKALAEYLFEKYSRLFHKLITGIDAGVFAELLQYQWPGNVRELENTVECMINMADHEGRITRALLPANIVQPKTVRVERMDAAAICSLQDMERQLITNALHVYGWTTAGKKAACSQLGIGIATLYRKIEQYRLTPK